MLATPAVRSTVPIRLKGGLGTAHLYVRLKVCVCVCVCVSDVMEQVSTMMKPRF